MAELRLGSTTAGGLAAGSEHGRQAGLHRQAAQGYINKARKKVSMAKHPASTESRRSEFAYSAETHLHNAQDHADKASSHEAKQRQAINAQPSETLSGRQSHFDAGRANAGNN